MAKTIISDKIFKQLKLWPITKKDAEAQDEEIKNTTVKEEEKEQIKATQQPEAV